MALRRRWLFGVVAIALVVAACNGGEESESSGDLPTLDVPVDSEQVSPAPDEAAAAAAYPALDLGFLGANASSSEIPSTIPAGLEVGFTEEGYPYRGSPDATVTLIEYSDYACPFCGRYTAQNVPALLEQYGVTGQVRFVFREFPLVSLHPTAPAGHTAALCAGEQGAELYWAVHDEIFTRQDEWANLPDPTEFFAELSQGVGVETTAYGECVESGRTDAVIQTGVDDAQALGFNGTPSFEFVADDLEDTYTLVGAQPLETFQSYVDALLAGEAPADAQAAEEPAEDQGLPFWADTETGLQPDPDRPGVNLAGDHYRGDPAAPLVVVEFSDFECPFCRDHAVETQPAIDEALVDTGDVLWVYKHLPLNIHPSAPAAAVAAECAGDQGYFWEMHDLLFASVERWSGEGVDTDVELLAIAAELPLDDALFESCFASREALERVLDDMSDARGVIAEAPSFVVIRGEQGARMEGSRPADDFVALLRSRLEGPEEEG